MITQKTLWKEMGRMTLLSAAIYVALFGILWLTEWTHPEIQGVLLQWTNLAWIVGIPASVLGTAYVLTIRNPQNYTGFYIGVIMSLLLAWQFYLQGQYDLVVLYVLIFVPFQIKSLVGWRSQTMQPAAPSKHDAFAPTFLPTNKALWTLFVTVVIVAVDYVLVTKVMRHDGWGDDVAGKVASAVMIASSFLANYWMIQKKNDAWLWWVVYCLAGLVLFVMIGNVFSILLFTIMLLVNMAAQIAWIRSTRLSGFGWMASKEQLVTMLQRQEQWLMKQLEQNRARQKDIPTDKDAVITKFGHIVDVVNRRIFDGCIEIQSGRIIRITEAEVPKSAVYILPGFYDSYIQIESTLLLPEYYARLAVEQGTIGAICDPHEIANVLGKEGVEYMIANGKKVNFHFHFLAGEGNSTGHECTTLDQACEGRKGMFCSEGKYPDELAKGYINEMCRRAVHKGSDVMDVLTAACVTPVKHYGLDSGLLQQGDWADFITVDNLSEFNLSETYIHGVQVVEDGIYTSQLIIDHTPASENYPNHFEADKISIEDIQVPQQKGQLKVIETTEGSPLTHLGLVTPKVEKGLVVSDTEQDVLKLVCVNRYQKQEPVVAFVRGFGLKQGALASTIFHDTHHIIAVGVSDKDIVDAINAVIELKGGLIVNDGKELLELMLPIAGLMSYRDGDKVARRHRQLKTIASRIGCKYQAPFMTLAYSTKLEDTDLWVCDTN